MLEPRRLGRKVSTAMTLGVALLALGACGSSSPTTSTSALAKATTTSSDSSSGNLAKVPSIASMVPAQLRAHGSINVASEDFPPAVTITQNNGLTGWEVEMGRDIGTVLGIPFHFHIIEWAALLPGLEAGKYDLGMGDIAMSPAREKVVDLVPTHEAHDAFATLSSSSIRLNSLQDACGRSLALLLGGAEVQEADAVQPTCKTDGKPPIDIHQYPSQADANLALQSGRAQVEATDSDTLAYVIAQTHGQFKLVGRYGPDLLTGIAIYKSPSSLQFAHAIVAAVKYLMKTGAYSKILTNYNYGQGAIPSSLVTVNPPKTTYVP